MSEMKKFSLELLKEAVQSTSFLRKYEKVEGSEVILDDFIVPQSTYGLQAAVEVEGMLVYFTPKDSALEFDDSSTLELSLFVALCDIVNDNNQVVLTKGQKKYFITAVL